MDSEALYQVYLSLGPGRTISRVSELTGKPLDSLYRVSAKQHWKNRVLADTYSLHSLPEGESSETALSAIARDSLTKLRESIKNLRPNSARDAKALLEIYLLLAGRATVITGEQEAGTIPQAFLDSLTPEQLELLGKGLQAEKNPTA